MYRNEKIYAVFACIYTSYRNYLGTNSTLAERERQRVRESEKLIVVRQKSWRGSPEAQGDEPMEVARVWFVLNRPIQSVAHFYHQEITVASFVGQILCRRPGKTKKKTCHTNRHEPQTKKKNLSMYRYTMINMYAYKT